MGKLAIISISIIVTLVISGCVEKSNESNSTNSVNAVKINMANISGNTTGNTTGDIKGDSINIRTVLNMTRLETQNENKDEYASDEYVLDETDAQVVDNKYDASTTVNEDNAWCKTGNKITAHGQEFIIEGVVEYQGELVCKAVRKIEGGTSTRYFNEDESFVSEISNSTGRNAKAYSEVKINKS